MARNWAAADHCRQLDSEGQGLLYKVLCSPTHEVVMRGTRSNTGVQRTDCQIQSLPILRRRFGRPLAFNNVALYFSRRIRRLSHTNRIVGGKRRLGCGKTRQEFDISGRHLAPCNGMKSHDLPTRAQSLSPCRCHRPSVTTLSCVFTASILC